MPGGIGYRMVVMCKASQVPGKCKNWYQKGPYIWIDVCISIYMNITVCVYIYIYIHTYTYIYNAEDEDARIRNLNVGLFYFCPVSVWQKHMSICFVADMWSICFVTYMQWVQVMLMHVTNHARAKQIKYIQLTYSKCAGGQTLGHCPGTSSYPSA